MRKKISIIGAGNVGREAAAWCAIKELGDIVLWNRTKEAAIGNALDLSEAAPLIGFDARIKGTGNLGDTKNSDIVVITSGLPRKPGMTREDLVKSNAGIVADLSKKVAKLSPKAVLVVLTNPLDAMSYVALKASKFPKQRVIGMAGILDGSRFKSFIAEELNVSVNDVSAVVLGSHGEDMVPLPRLSEIGGVNLYELMPKEKIEKIVERTKNAGAEIVKLLSANASFSVGAATARLVESIVKDKKEILSCSVLLNGEYGINGVYLGVPCVIGIKGVEKIIQLSLNKAEKSLLEAASKRIKSLIKETGV